jgi:hypothetical protein
MTSLATVPRTGALSITTDSTMQGRTGSYGGPRGGRPNPNHIGYRMEAY